MFFFDTADIAYIKKLWKKMSKDIPSDLVAGITTNPNAFSKINLNDLSDWKSTTQNLCKLVTDIRRDSKGIVYVQIPYSKMKKNNINEWINLILDWSDGKTQIGLKIPPFVEALELANSLKDKIDFNVTGVSDCSTALRAFSYNVRYVSFIPGRMEEKGINAKEQISFVNQRNNSRSEIITGSMRNIEGLAWACAYNTVPTIGTRVWDEIEQKISNQEFLKILESRQILDKIDFSPLVNNHMVDLSLDFFSQMDKLGSKIYKDFLTIN
jgi:transaldolase